MDQQGLDLPFCLKLVTRPWTRGMSSSIRVIGHQAVKDRWTLKDEKDRGERTLAQA